MLYYFGENSKVTEKYQFETARLSCLLRPIAFGLDENWYGGRVTKIARVKESVILILANDANETIDTAVESERIKELELSELKKMMKLLGIVFDGKLGSKEQLLSILDSATGEQPEKTAQADAL